MTKPGIFIKNGRAGRKAKYGFVLFHNASATYDEESAFPEDQLTSEVQAQEAAAAEEIALFGVIRGETGAYPIERIYDALGWQDSLTCPNERHEVVPLPVLGDWRQPE